MDSTIPNQTSLPLDRLINQCITNNRRAHPGEVVAWMGAMQAQDYTAALWAVGLRTTGATQATVEAAIADGKIVRTWPLRGTLHFVSPQDVRWMLKLLTPRVIAQTACRYRQLELDDVIFNRSKDVFANSLRDGKQLTRVELYQRLEQANIATSGQRGYHLLARAAQDGLICFGAPRGKQETFTLLDEWAPGGVQLTREEALIELTQRYFTSHGPATQQDFMRWAGLTGAEAKQGLAAQSGLIRETLAGVDYWLSPAATRSAPPPESLSAHLLPGFDEYLLGYRDRSAILDPAFAGRVCPGGNGVFYPMIVIQGRIVGVWKRLMKKDRVVITPDLFPSYELNADQIEALTAACQQYGGYLGIPITVLP